MKDHQITKWVVNRAIDVVGGSGFMDNNPLSRLYRNLPVRAFVQSYAPTEARDYIGKVALSIYPEK